MHSEKMTYTRDISFPKGPSSSLTTGVYAHSSAHSLPLMIDHKFFYRSFFNDPKTYPDPDVFLPERFISSEGHLKQQDPRSYLFGFGRR